MSETSYEAPLEPAVEPAAEPENEPWLYEYLGDPSENDYAVRVEELEREEQLEQFKAAVDERIQPLAEWAESKEAERQEVEGLAIAEKMVSEIGKTHGVELDFEQIVGEANSWYESNRAALVNHFVQTGVDLAQAQALVNNQGAAAVLDWFAKQAIPAKDEMALLGRYMGQNVANGRVPKDSNGEPLPAGDEMNVLRKHFPKG
jgi:hypothetical protein